MEGIEFTPTITITFNKPTKPYWELFGYESEAAMYAASHLHYKTVDGDYCATCGTELKDCSLANLK